jgi:RNA polymerase sigma-70 factor (ECF subfamily)
VCRKHEKIEKVTDSQDDDFVVNWRPVGDPKTSVFSSDFYCLPNKLVAVSPVDQECSIFKIVDTASSQPGGLLLPKPIAQQSTPDSQPGISELPQNLIHELWLLADAATCGLTVEEFGTTLASVGTKLNYGLPHGAIPDPVQKATFLRSLRVSELALAHSCALGREVAWQRFLGLYRVPIVEAAVAITGSDTLGRDLADSLYVELYGLRQLEGPRRSPLASYSGRGSLLGWLRATLAQRHVDHHRRTRRETPLDNVDIAAPIATPEPLPAELSRLSEAVARTLRDLAPEDRFLLSCYFLDRQTLIQISRTVRVHEATVSRRLKRLLSDLRKQLLTNLQSGGLSKRAAEEALGADPRDLEINLRGLLQTSQTDSFPDRAASDPL